MGKLTDILAGAQTSQDSRTYAEKLKDPRWQRKRLEILERDGWACVKCGETTNTLQVHHRYYNFGTDPWEYPNTALVTLCDECHKEEQGLSKEAWELLKEACGIAGFLAGDVLALSQAVASLRNAPALPEVVSTALEWGFVKGGFSERIIDDYFAALRTESEAHLV